MQIAPENYECLPKCVQTAVGNALLRVHRWQVPGNHSHRDWHRELDQVGWCAACLAERDSQQASEDLIRRRVVAEVLRYYRREWSYFWRFQSVAPHEQEQPEDNSFEKNELVLEQILFPEPAEFEQLREALMLLSSSERTLLVSLFWYGHTEAEIAVTLDLSQRAVSKRKESAISALRKVLTRTF